MNKIRLIKTSAFYKYYIKHFYDKNPDLKDASYERQFTAMMADCFAWADFWKKHLEATGRYEVEEIVINNEYMQKQWAKEHHVYYNENNWQNDILQAQIAASRPDVWFSHADMDPELRLRIRRDHPRIKFVLGYDGTLKHNAGFFAGCDSILSCIDDTIQYYKLHGYNGYFLPYAFERDLLTKIQIREPQYNVSFVGSFYPFKGLHSERLRLITGLSKETHVDIWSPVILHKGFAGYWYAVSRLVRNRQWKDISCSNYIDKTRHGAVYGLNMYQVLSDSKITLNFHGDIVIKKGGNMRLFEATGAGACLLTDRKENLPDFFDLDREIVAFKTYDECLEKILYLLSHEDERKAIAQAGQKRTLEEYSYDNVLKQFIEYLESNLKPLVKK